MHLYVVEYDHWQTVFFRSEPMTAQEAARMLVEDGNFRMLPTSAIEHRKSPGEALVGVVHLTRLGFFAKVTNVGSSPERGKGYGSRNQPAMGDRW